jgi:hypothetical protein
VDFLVLWGFCSALNESAPSLGKRLLAFLVLALLVSDTAACLASRLARGLALTATAVLCAFAKVTSFNSFDMFHSS